MNYRFTATLNCKQGSRIFRGTTHACETYSKGLYVIRHLLDEHKAFQPDVTSIKITISPCKQSPRTKPNERKREN